MLSDEGVQIVSPVYYRNDLLPRKTGITFSDSILIKVKPKTSLRSVKNLLRNFGSITGGKIKLADGVLYQARIKNPKQSSALEVAGEIEKLSRIVKVVNLILWFLLLFSTGFRTIRTLLIMGSTKD